MAGVQAARDHAQTVLRVRSSAVAVAALPAAVAAVLIAGGVTGHLGAAGTPDAAGWDAARWVVSSIAALVLLAVPAFALVLRRVRLPQVPAVQVAESAAPELYRLVRDIAERMDVPAPAQVALTPDCDSWLEDPPPGSTRRSEQATAGPAAAGPAAAGQAAPGSAARERVGVGAGPGSEHPLDTLGREKAGPPAPTLVIGSPFMWWMRVAELRALLAPVVAGTACSADPDIASARRFVRALDAALGVAVDRATAPWWQRPALALLGRISGTLLVRCRGHAAEMERAVATWASEQAKQVDYGLRIAAQEQVGLVYAGWDRLLTRVALPAWRIGRWPGRLDAGVVAALSELSRRDRLAEGFGSRLGERPACDLLEEPGLIDETVSLLAARLFHGGEDADTSHWSPVDWADYPTEVVERIWRTQADELAALLDCGPGGGPGPEAGPEAEPGGDGGVIARLLGRLRDGAAEELATALTTRRLRAAESGLPQLQPQFQLQPPRTGRDLLGEHLTALVCSAAVQTGAAEAGLDWLDGPVLLVGGVRRSDLAAPVALAVDHGDDEPLLAWLDELGIRVEKPVRLP